LAIELIIAEVLMFARVCPRTRFFGSQGLASSWNRRDKTGIELFVDSARFLEALILAQIGSSAFKIKTG
jgi:hypothetical protein